jgi:clan AA aspartic protease (TIGR02281 family)
MTKNDAVLEPNSDAISGYNNPETALPRDDVSLPTNDNGGIGLPSKTVIPLKNERGIFVVPVEINGAITLDFVVDSGASDVSVPADVVSTLIRTRTIGPSDFVGQQTYVLADGSEAPSDTFIIRSLKVGDHVVQNVRASIASPKATLLLGQSFLRHFKSWSIDNAKHALVLE